MALTDKQKQNIHSLDTATALEVMHECAERLGIVSVDEYCKIMGAKRRTVYQAMKDNKIKKLEISGHVFPVINK